jgi:hypothetical protein
MKSAQSNFKYLYLSATPVLDTAATTAGDVLAPTIELSGGAFSYPAYGDLLHINVLDKSGNAAALDVVLLNSATDLGTAGAAISISDADAEKIVLTQQVPVDNYINLVNSQRASVPCVVPFKQALSGKLYLALVDRTGGNTYAASDLIVELYIRLDNP